jgi:hypothetical protein
MRLSELKGCTKVTYLNNKHKDIVYYKDRTKMYTIRFYYKSHIRFKRTGVQLQRLDFTQDWYSK